MTHYYSPSAKGFFLDSIHKNIPNDAIALTEEQYTELVNCDPAKEIAYIDGRLVMVDRDLSITWGMVRSKRDRLIAKTDWTQLADVPAEVSEKYKLYRQALRDVPQTNSNPNQVVWPEKSDYGI